jgi:3-oxoacyl-[acyl-carrier-protein] synthase-1
MLALGRCHLVGIGATTAVGGTASVSMAAFRAGLTRTERVAHGGDEEAWSHAVRVVTLEPSEAAERERALLWSALVQGWQPLKEKIRGLRIGVWCAGPAWQPDFIVRQLGLDPRHVLHVDEHACSGLFALREASAALSEQRVDVAWAVGVGVESHSAGLDRGREQGRVLGGESSFGTVPGEAAAALVLVSERVRQQLSLTSLGQLVAIATAEEKTLFGGPVPCVGNALIEAARAVLAALPKGERVAQVLCDLNGERERTDEWGFALPRLSSQLQAPGAFITPISAFGDVGAPSGLLLVALASAACKRPDAPAPCLIWTSSPGSPRAAALFEAPAATPVSAAASSPAEPASIPAPSWALALDASILAELVDEAAFRQEQRQYEYARAPAGAPDAIRPALTRIEGALDQLVQGLVECGRRAWDLVEAPLAAKPTPAALYVASRVLFEADRPERALRILEQHAASSSAYAEAARRGIEHARPSAARLQPCIQALIGGGPVLAALGLDLATHASTRVSVAQLRAVSDAVPEDDVDAAAAWLDALALHGNPEAAPAIRRWQLSRHDRLRRCWAQAELCLGGAEGKAAVLARSEQDPAVILPAVIAVGGARVRAFRDLASALSGSDACLALGILGDAQAVPLLIERLGDLLTSETAAYALEILLGATPGATRTEPDTDPSAPPRQVPCISRAPADWQKRADLVLSRHPPQTRLRAGTLASVPSTLTLLGRLHLPVRARRYLARELRGRWNVRQPPSVQALLRQQRLALGTLEPPPSAPKPGSWD